MRRLRTLIRDLLALFVAIRTINRSTLRSFRESIEAVAGKASLVVTAGEAGFPEEALERVQAVPGVRLAVATCCSKEPMGESTISTTHRRWKPRGITGDCERIRSFGFEN